MIKAILFDLDETLIDRTETMRRFLLEQHGLFAELAAFSAPVYSAVCLSQQANGYADKLDAYVSACHELGVGSSGLAQRLFVDFKDRYGERPVLFSGVMATLKQLHGRYQLGLVTNGRVKGQMAKIEASGIKRFFSSICISESLGCKKPDATIFQACLDELSVAADEALFVGDNPTADIEPARKLGMFTVWVKSEYFSAPQLCDGIVSGVGELARCLRALERVD
ncbi:HAD family hydrolase [Gilvimarinus xylanilyticus]|uniref:HAD family hydrolase n=1 Tax=Gilvimarinus xylanilyticus TaxID=2944139 RepID=A0A9X2HX79_9GAMM|nr:HAD family hydrolase [Gilvimarinus xylanilyticus]MCP8898704.1 HAD family hydrolase [Gilvimarinus xylanilyticus]